MELKFSLWKFSCMELPLFIITVHLEICLDTGIVQRKFFRIENLHFRVFRCSINAIYHKLGEWYWVLYFLGDFCANREYSLKQLEKIHQIIHTSVHLEVIVKNWRENDSKLLSKAQQKVLMSFHSCDRLILLITIYLFELLLCIEIS